MLDTFKKLVPKDDDLPARAWTIAWREEFRSGVIYNRLAYEFAEERNSADEYVPLAKRKPSVRFGLPTIIVNDTTSLLFSEGHFPTIQCGSNTDEDEAVGAASAAQAKAMEKLDKTFAKFVRDVKLRELMLETSVRGSVGSVAVWLRVLKNRIFLKVLPTTYLTPVWDELAPDTLTSVKEKRKVSGKELRLAGYVIADKDLDRKFWFQRIWTTTSEDWYVPWPVDLSEQDKANPVYKPEVIDKERTKAHGLGFVPIQWVRNLPGGDDVDGVCTFEAALHNSIEIDYQLSQAGRGLKYSSDPTMHIKEPAYQEQGGGSVIVKSADRAIVTGVNGDVKMVEISGSAAAAVETYVRMLREFSLELCGGNRTSPEKLSGAQSGKAMEVMNQALIWIADKLRTSYGEGALAGILRMVLAANQVLDLQIAGQRYAKGKLPKPDAVSLNLKWPPWYAPTHTDHSAQATGIKTLRDSGVLSRETAIHKLAPDYDIDNVQEEIIRLDDEAKNKQELEIETAKATMPPKPVAVAKAA